MRTEGRKKSTQIGQEKTVTPATAPRDTCLVAGVMHGGVRGGLLLVSLVPRGQYPGSTS